MAGRRLTITWMILGILTISGIGIQFIPVKRINPPIRSALSAPPEIKAILKRSCYDCHSHETVWPWYSAIAPVSWLVVRDVNEGREKLNFSDWSRQLRDKDIQEEIIEEIEEGEMPLKLYVLAHPGTSVSPEELDLLRRWTP